MFLDYEKLYNTYFMEVYSFVMTIVKSAHMAEEITLKIHQILHLDCLSSSCHILSIRLRCRML